MAMIHGESVRIELLTEQGWRDLGDCAGSVEDGVDMAVVKWLAESITFTVTIEDWKEVVETAGGKAIAAVPRMEM